MDRPADISGLIRERSFDETDRHQKANLNSWACFMDIKRVIRLAAYPLRAASIASLIWSMCVRS
jgi:hypothetical protein